MEHETPQESDEFRIVTEAESCQLNRERIVPSVQGALRKMLQTQDALLRQRLVALLNPRNAPVIELTDEKFRHDYVITTEDNYAPPGDIDNADRNACFDARHGYYVTLRIEPFFDFP